MRGAVFVAALLLLCFVGESNAQVSDTIQLMVEIIMSGSTQVELDAKDLNATQVEEKLTWLAENEADKFALLRDALVGEVGTDYVADSVVVQECRVGRYIDGATGLCTPCPAGTYSTTAFSTRASDCLSCGAGTYSETVAANNASACVPCPAGTFSGVIGASNASVCRTCGAFATSVIGAQGDSACVCFNGYYLDGADGVCKACEPGYVCSGNNRVECPGYSAEPSMSVSPARSWDIMQCYCRPGYFGWAYDGTGCSLCMERAYCDGRLSDTNGAVMNSCPENSFSPAGSTSMDDCVCDASYRAQYSTPGERLFDVTADLCNCSAVASGQPRCGGLDAVNCGRCLKDTNCETGSSLAAATTLTCKQGHLQMGPLAGGATFPASTTRIWKIAPVGAERVRVTLTVNSLSSGQSVTFHQCKDVNCSFRDPTALATVSNSVSVPRHYVTTGDYRVVQVTFTATSASSNPFKLEYGSEIFCEKNLAVSATQVSYILSGNTELNPYISSGNLPIVVWLGDILTFDARLQVLDVRTSAGVSVLNPDFGMSKWIPSSVGSYWLTDLTYSGRRREIFVAPVDSRRLGVWYTVAGTPASFTLSGDVVGSGSPDIVLVSKDVLSLTRLSSTSGVMLLSSYTNASVYTVLGGAGVSGQSRVGVLETSVTWDTTGYASGLYYYANVGSTAGAITAVRMGRIFLNPLSGGLTCSECRPGEYCYDGTVMKCPANSRSPARSDSKDDCVCAPGFAQSTLDLEAYSNALTVDSGGRHSCAIGADGRLWCWGMNDRGQLGIGSMSGTAVGTPQVVPRLADVRNVSLGDDFTCVIYGSDLRVKCWGDNIYGQLGLDSYINEQTSPIDDAKLGTGSTPYSTKSLACAGATCCAIVEKLEAASLVSVLTCWGRGNVGQLGAGGTGYNTANIGTGTGLPPYGNRYSFANTGQAVVVAGEIVLHAVTVAAQHACAVGTKGEVVCWGDNQYGSVGSGTSGVRFMTPTLIDVGGAVKTVNCYDYVCCAVMYGLYTVKCWGWAANGRLGVGAFDVGLTSGSMGKNLQAVDLGPTSFVIDVNVGSLQTCVLLSNNFVKCWGLVGGSVIGDNPPVDLMEILPGVSLVEDKVAIQINGKMNTTCAVTSDYKVVCWAPSNDFKQLGDGDTAVVSSAVGSVRMGLVNVSDGGGVLASAGSATDKSCVMCVKGTYCPGEGILPLSCPLNTMSNVQSSRPEDCVCLPGYKPSGAGDGSCGICSGRSYCVVGQEYQCDQNSATVVAGSSSKSACQCDRGYFFAGVSLGCSPCGLGLYKDNVSNAGSCSACPAGTSNGGMALGNASGCVRCEAGTAASEGSAVCTGCGEGTAAGAGSGVCIACGAGFYAGARASACLACGAGTFDGAPRDGRPGTCQNCVAGKFSGATNVTEESACAECDAGTFSREGAAVCVQCGVGEYSVRGAVMCEKCPGNSTSARGSMLEGCQCLAGFKKVMKTDTFVCEQCGPGTYSGNGSLECTPCGAGTVSVARGATSSAVCSVCSAGRFAAAGSSVCGVCGVSTFSAAPRSENCTECGAGFYAGTGASVCIGCVAGTYATGRITGISGCLPCPAGSFCVGSEIARQRGVAVIEECPIGTFSNVTRVADVTQCRPCPANFYCPSPTLRGVCPVGTRSNASSVSQLACTCTTGYTCNYNKVVSAVITLMMSTFEWDNNLEVQAAFKAAVAEAAGTDPSKVRIVRVQSVGGAGGRRLLEQRYEKGKGKGVHVLMEIVGGSGRNLEANYVRKLLSVGIAAETRHGVAWIEPHEVVAQKTGISVASHIYERENY